VRWLQHQDQPDAPRRPRIRFTALTTDDDETDSGAADAEPAGS
jgi:hypothetical protein